MAYFDMSDPKHPSLVGEPGDTLEDCLAALERELAKIPLTSEESFVARRALVGTSTWGSPEKFTELMNREYDNLTEIKRLTAEDPDNPWGMTDKEREVIRRALEDLTPEQLEWISDGVKRGERPLVGWDNSMLDKFMWDKVYEERARTAAR